MNIGFDGKRAANNFTGLGNYSRSLITQLVKYYPNNKYLVYTPAVKDSVQISSFFNQANVELKLPKRKTISFIWRSLKIIRQLKDDDVHVFHGLSQEIPFGLKKTGIFSVVTIHDLIFLRFPNYYKPINRFLYNFKANYAAKHSDRIIAISLKTKQDLIEFYKISEDKIDVIYQSCDDSFKDLLSYEDKKQIKEKYNLPEKYILNVGTIEARKNLLLIIEALPEIDPLYKLVVVGKEQSYAKQVKTRINELALSDRVIFLKDLAFKDLPAVYQLASVFAYPSFYEGFGIPVIEALYSQVPVVAATGSCLEEAGGPDSKYVDPYDSSRLASAVNEIVNDPLLKAKMISSGLRYVQKFNNQTLTKQLMDCYSKASNSR